MLSLFITQYQKDKTSTNTLVAPSLFQCNTSTKFSNAFSKMVTEIVQDDQIDNKPVKFQVKIWRWTSHSLLADLMINQFTVAYMCH